MPHRRCAHAPRVGAVKPATVRKYLHTLYQFTQRWVVDDTKFRTALGAAATPLGAALDGTLDWYRTADHLEGHDHGHPDHTAIAALAMAGAATLAIAGFTVLGVIFDYPAILDEPTAEILAAFRRHEGTVIGWFLVLAISAGLLGPIGILLGRSTGGRLGRWIAGVGIAAGDGAGDRALPAWVLAVPGAQHDALAARSRRGCAPHVRAAAHVARRVHRRDGGTATATFTIRVVIGVTWRIAPRWMSWIGNASAVLIASGVVIPLGIEAASISNFIGYVVWYLWLVAMAVVLWEPGLTIAACCGSRCSGRLRSSKTTASWRSRPAGPPSPLSAWRWTSAARVRSERLIEDLWEAEASVVGRNTLESKVSQLRHALADRAAVAGGDGGYRLAVDPNHVDAIAVMRQAVDASHLLDVGDARGAAVLQPVDAGDVPRGRRPSRCWRVGCAVPGTCLDAVRLTLLETGLAARLRSPATASCSAISRRPSPPIRTTRTCGPC